MARVVVGEFEGAVRSALSRACFKDTAAEEDLSVDDIKHVSAEQQIRQSIRQRIAQYESGFAAASGGGTQSSQDAGGSSASPSAPPLAPRFPLASSLETERGVFRSIGREVNYMPRTRAPADADHVPIPLAATEVIINVAQYHASRPVKLVEYNFLANHTLADVHEHLYCVLYVLPATVDSAPNGSAFGKLSAMKDFGRARAYLLIEDCVYFDARQPQSADMAPLQQWAAENGITLPQRACAMQEMRLRELAVRPDVPYLYVHHDDCCHQVVFADLRLIGADDPRDAALYPLLAYQGKILRRKCSMCDIYAARVVAFGDHLSDQNPTLFCQRCFHQLHYSANDHLLHRELRVFSYIHE